MGALPARGLLLQDVHGSGVGLGAAVRTADPSSRGPGPAGSDRRRARRARRDRPRPRGRAGSRRGRGRPRRSASSGCVRPQGAAGGPGRGARRRLAARCALDRVAREPVRRASPACPRCAACPAPPCSGPTATACSERSKPSRPRKAARFGGLRERLRIIRARRVIVATGCARAADRLPRQRSSRRDARRRRARSICAATVWRQGAGPRFSSTTTRPTRRCSRSPAPVSNAPA